MKVAKQSWRSAASRISRLKKKISSASWIGSPCCRLISTWPEPPSWVMPSISNPWASAKS